MDLKALNFDWRTIGRYLNPKALDDVNSLLEKLPHHTNKVLLIIAAVIWVIAFALGLYTTVKMQEMSELVVKREEAQGLLPAVPKLKDNPVHAKELASFVDELQKIYKGLEIKGNSSNIVIRAKATSSFGQFREAIGHIQNGGDGWHVDVEKLCVGRECKQYPLAAVLKINKVTVERATAN
ncbi:MAG: hypothetical protein ACRBCK_03355 [Alphaproteobacteria bacterium]